VTIEQSALQLCNQEVFGSVFGLKADCFESSGENWDNTFKCVLPNPYLLTIYDHLPISFTAV
jgi:hypothetical protein